MVNDTRQGWALLMAMTLVLAMLLGITIRSELQGNPALIELGINQHASKLTARWQYGRQRSPFRDHQFSLVGYLNHCCIERVGQFDARFLFSTRRVGSDVDDTAK